MIEIRNATAADRDALFAIWREAFGDTDEYISRFFTTAYSDSHCRVLCVDNEIASVLYIIDGFLKKRKIAYIYAVATYKRYRGRGLYRQLSENTHEYLKDLGYEAEILVPATKELFTFYSNLGYKAVGFADSFEAVAAPTAAFLKQLDCYEYTALRQKLLPENGVILGDKGLAFLNSIAIFYATENTVIACETRNGKLFVHELLGKKSEASAILAALNIKQGVFRATGTDPFLMGYSLKGEIDNIYYALAFD